MTCEQNIARIQIEVCLVKVLSTTASRRELALWNMNSKNSLYQSILALKSYNVYRMVATAQQPSSVTQRRFRSGENSSCTRFTPEQTYKPIKLGQYHASIKTQCVRNNLSERGYFSNDEGWQVYIYICVSQFLRSDKIYVTQPCPLEIAYIQKDLRCHKAERGRPIREAVITRIMNIMRPTLDFVMRTGGG